jgi:hypothetical protein
MNLVHIGLPKAGSTTLQNRLFAEQNYFAYIGKSASSYPSQCRELVNRISFQDSLAYDQARAESLVVQLYQGSKPLLMSDENFSIEGAADRRLVAERLHHLFKPAKVLLIVRAQLAMVQSMYLNHVRATYLKNVSGLGRRTITFSNWLEENYGNEVFFPNRVALNYEPLVSNYERVFGADNVIVLPFEMIRDENSIFAASIADLLHMSLSTVRARLKTIDNQRASERHLLALRIQNSLPTGTNLALLGRRSLPKSIYNLFHRFVTGGARVESPALPEIWKTRISALCARGNAAIEARKAIPLRALGYPTEP